MSELEPSNQPNLFGLEDHLLELIRLYNNDIYPNKLLLSGQKGIGKSTLAYHFVNFVLTKGEDFHYDLENFKINTDSPIFKTILNKTNTNFTIIDIKTDKKFIDINQIREMILNLNKSSFNTKPRFVMIDNIEFLNKNSINALLKILEEPNENINFILIHNNKKILSTLLSRCINYKINLTNKESLEVSKYLLNNDLEKLLNKDFINYFFTPGIYFNLVKFAEDNKYDLLDLSLKKFIKILIKEKHYKNNSFINDIIYHLIEYYFCKISLSFSKNLYKKYSYFIKRMSYTKTFNLDEEALFNEFEEEILDG